jgi:hypothetical protein
LSAETDYCLHINHAENAAVKRISTALGLALAVIVSVASTSALAGGPYHRYGGYGGYYGPRVGVGVYFGGPGYYGPAYPYYGSPYAYGYGPGYYYPPAVITVPSAPITYIEQPQVVQPVPQPAPQAAPQAQQAWWYYCADSNAYYPWVKECASTWKRVAPVPPPQG